MLICDTHADTLCKLATERHLPVDVDREMLVNDQHIHVQALALYVRTGGMQTNPTIVEMELNAFEKLKAQGWHPVTRVEDALAHTANALLTIEGCEAFGGDVDNVDKYADLGVRIAALTWNNPNGLCTPACINSQDGLTDLGRVMVKRMRERHIAVDTSHLNVGGFFDLLDGTVPPMASHSCAYALCPHVRNLTDDQLRQLFGAGGFVGVNFYSEFLNPEGKADLDTVVDHIAYMCDLGGENHVGLGSDFDGIDKYPQGLRTAADVPALLERMRKRGFGEKTVEKIAGLNFRDYMNRI